MQTTVPDESSTTPIEANPSKSTAIVTATSSPSSATVTSSSGTVTSSSSTVTSSSGTVTSSSGTVTSSSGTTSSHSSVDLSSIDGISDIAEMIGVLQFVAVVIVENIDSLKATFTTYQKSRTTCVVELIRLQSAAWCLACDPYSTTKGFSAATRTISISEKVCNRLQDSCFNFVSSASDQNVILTASYMSDLFDSFAILIKALLTGDTSEMSQFSSDETNESGSPSSPEETPSEIPDDCTSENCDWICESLFVAGQVDQETLAAGGSIQSDTTNGRLLLQDMAQGTKNIRNFPHRMLGGSEFNPDADEAGVTVNFQDDPGNVNSSPKVLKTSVVCVFVLVLSIMI